MKHTLWCRIVMALASRRVCMCGASPKPNATAQRRAYRRMERKNAGVR